MDVSKKGEEFIKGMEGCVLRAYLPTPNDVPTIGYGTTGKDIHLGMVWTKEQADTRFHQDLSRFASAVDKLIHSPTTQDQFDAMVSLAYNIGLTAFANSTLLRMHNGKNYDGAQMQFGRWNKQAGKVLAGLTKRRAFEAELYRGDLH